MQGPPGAQRQEELEGTGDAIQITQWLEVLGSRGKGEWASAPRWASRPTPTRSVSFCGRLSCPSSNPLYLWL